MKINLQTLFQIKFPNDQNHEETETMPCDMCIFLGVKHAAIRKLEHELGIARKQITPDELMFLTRVHYRSATDSPQWGEHESGWRCAV